MCRSKNYTDPIYSGATAFLFCIALLGPGAGHGAEADAPGNDPAMARLQAEIEEIAQAAGGLVGVSVQHIESGRQFRLNGNARFPMASTVKLPLAVQFLALVEQGAVPMDKIITLKPGDLRRGSGVLTQTFDESRADRSLQQLFELMLIHSDNTATDVIWKEGGGKDAIAVRLAGLGVSGISADRPILDLLAAIWGIVPPENEPTPARLLELRRKVPGHARAAAVAAFLKDERDTASPDAMATLLIRIWRKEALSAEGTAYLLDVMYRCATGKGRLKGMLPSAAKVFHKTGTHEIGATNDVGIVQLPDGAGTLAIAVMIRESPETLAMQERAIARIAWATYKYFVPR